MPRRRKRKPSSSCNGTSGEKRQKALPPAPVPLIPPPPQDAWTRLYGGYVHQPETMAEANARHGRMLLGRDAPGQLQEHVDQIKRSLDGPVAAVNIWLIAEYAMAGTCSKCLVRYPSYAGLCMGCGGKQEMLARQALWDSYKLDDSEFAKYVAKARALARQTMFEHVGLAYMLVTISPAFNRFFSEDQIRTLTDVIVSGRLMSEQTPPAATAFAFATRFTFIPASASGVVIPNDGQDGCAIWRAMSQNAEFFRSKTTAWIEGLFRAGPKDHQEFILYCHKPCN